MLTLSKAVRGWNEKKEQIVEEKAAGVLLLRGRIRNNMEMEKTIIDAFKKNRVGIRISERYDGLSVTEYVFKKITKEDVTSRRMANITKELTSALSFVPEIYEDRIFDEISVVVRNPVPVILGYSQKDTLVSEDEEEKGVFTFDAGSDAIDPDLRSYNLKEYSPMLIYGDDGYGKTNFIKVILEEFKERDNFRFIVADPLKKGEYDSKVRDPRYTIIKNKDEIMDALSNLEKVIKNRAALLKTAKKEKRGFTEEEKKDLGPIIFVIDDYSPLLCDKKTGEKIKKITACVSKKGFQYDVFLILSSPGVPAIFTGEDTGELFKSIVAFRCDNCPDIGYNMLKTPLYYPGEAMFFDIFFFGGDRIQCFKLEE